MEITEKIMTRNDCYRANRKITPRGIMVHSTATPGVRAGEWFDRWNKSFEAGETDRQVCVHAFLDDTDIYQYLPWDHRGWHAGGKANDTYIGFEICEPGGFTYRGAEMIGYDPVLNEEYFRKVFRRAAELCAWLCRKYGFDETAIITHCEGHRLGIASDHADVMHWFPKHGESMDTFRALVRKILSE
ncbi:MAG TPA: N-acetylmuramoyl-L-alanine amidase [Acholeplasmataceae bacterium]|nr:N-acetylmuramoyl-L-alanine amidase [Acholeplasmataceae bacterium]